LDPSVWTAGPTSKVKELAAMLKDIKLADSAALAVVGIEKTLF